MKHPSAYRKSAATGSDHSGLKKQKGVNMGRLWLHILKRTQALSAG